MLRNLLPVACGMLAWLSGGLAVAAISLQQDFDGGSLNVTGTIVSGNKVELAPRLTFNNASYQWIYFQAAGVQDATPEFRISNDGALEPVNADHRYVYSYDRTAWEFFDNGARLGDDYVFSNNSAFSQDEVFVAYSLP